ncbi:hypothetical protein KQUDLBSD_CDS0140 [Staphylococcus phage PG-2021_40]|nr:hypothetical protein [Mammaliicoccus phage vB_MscM-PMS3]WBF82214.1 hypothetical protein [Mammaliicoccus virus vB_MscM-PMS2]
MSKIVLWDENDLVTIRKEMANKEQVIELVLTPKFIEYGKAHTIMNHVEIIMKEFPEYKIRNYGVDSRDERLVGYIFERQGE